MSKQIVGIGTAANDGTGDPLRTAFQKLNGNFDEVYAGHQLDPIAQTIVANAVDLFIYDTSKDSDGGAWRKCTQHTRWYNETLNTATRGATKKFPAKALIAAEAAKVTIYNLTQPTAPMWMVFDKVAYGILAFSRYNTGNATANITSVSMRNGVLCVGCANTGNYDLGLYVIDFLKENAVQYTSSSRGGATYSGNIAQRNTNLGGYASAHTIANYSVNDVAMTVLDDAPIDSATGLPVPTIAVATNGGVSVIKHDGTVVNSAQTIGHLYVDFLADGRLWYARNDSQCRVADSPFPAGFTGRVYSHGTIPALPNGISNINSGSAAHKAVIYRGIDTGLTILHENPATQANGMVAYLTSTYNTGWMVGDIQCDLVADGGTVTDRSVKGIAVTGTYTAQAVATGADKQSFTPTTNPVTATLGASVASGQLMWWEKVGGIWHHYVADVDAAGNTLTTGYVDGVTGTPSTSVTVSAGTALSIAVGAEVADVRATATAATAEQIAYMYETERKLFEANAKALISADAVTRLDYNEDAEILGVETAAAYDYLHGLEVIQRGVALTDVTDLGFERVQVNGTTDVRVASPAKSLRDELQRKDEAIARLQGSVVLYNTPSGTTYQLPQGLKPISCVSTGASPAVIDLSGSNLTFDGFRWTIGGLTASTKYMITARRV